MNIPDRAFVPTFIYDKFLAEASTNATQADPDKISKDLLENIHMLFGPAEWVPILIMLTLIYGAIFFSIFSNRNKPHIQSRSPILMLMITVGVYFDSILKLAILSIEYKSIDLKC
jgi:hypothetical protein